jgi:hypothetical protein
MGEGNRLRKHQSELSLCNIIPVGCEHFVVVGLTRIEADTMTPRDYKSRKSTRLGLERVLSLHLRC